MPYAPFILQDMFSGYMCGLDKNGDGVWSWEEMLPIVKAFYHTLWGQIAEVRFCLVFGDFVHRHPQTAEPGSSAAVALAELRSSTMNQSSHNSSSSSSESDDSEEGGVSVDSQRPHTLQTDGSRDKQLVEIVNYGDGISLSKK